MWLEHLNLVVGQESGWTEHFYFRGLGLTRDPARPCGPTIWANIGQQQFHLVGSTGADEPPQVINGTIGIALPDLDALKDRLEQLSSSQNLSGSMFGFIKYQLDGKIVAIEVTCPWGNRFVAHSTSLPHAKPTGPVPSTVLGKMHHGVDKYLGVRGGAGIKYIEFLTEPGTADKIGEFYNTHFGCGTDAVKGHQIVGIGQGVSLIFTEVEGATSDPRQSGCHIAIYLSHFEKMLDSFIAKGLTWTNPRFATLDSCDTKEQAMECMQFRFKDILVDGKKVFELEHETRASSHVQFFKSVYYIKC